MSYQKEAAVRADKANGCRITRWLHRRGSGDTFITQEIPSKKKRKVFYRGQGFWLQPLTRNCDFTMHVGKGEFCVYNNLAWI